MSTFKRITFEMSLKPFFETTDEYINKVCRKAFENWRMLAKSAQIIGVMIDTSDGSEILEYSGNMKDRFEWAEYIGNANLSYKDRPETDVGDILEVTKYCENPAIMTYEILAKIVKALKNEGKKITGKEIKVGTIFDPGPEFAKSEFKYTNHREILFGNTMGAESFVCCYSTLKGDTRHYAGFPNGIPDETPFGTFFGRQAQSFLTDLGFDYIWFSNGFGFGSEGWGTTGAIYDGNQFHIEKMDAAQDKLIEFWKLFRAECNFPVQTRGTNLSVGIDLARDAVNLKKIYNGDFDILTPPNSPWAALDGDFGLELSGYMSRIANLPPQGEYLFRYYLSDPWWMNEPYYQRYEGEPHDIFLPLAVARIDEKGNMHNPDNFNILSIDTSRGEIPERFAIDLTKHIMDAKSSSPDAPSPFVWVYPFDEYNDLKAGRAEKPFFEDWFIRGAINNGLPLSTVVSTNNFISTYKNDPQLYKNTVLITPVPEMNSSVAPILIDYIKSGGKVMFYGSTEGADSDWLSFMELESAESIIGEMTLDDTFTPIDKFGDAKMSNKILHDPTISDGGIDTVIKADAKCTELLATVTDNEGNKRAYAVSRTTEGQSFGRALWLRGTNCCRFVKGSYLLQPDDPQQYAIVEALIRRLLINFDWDISFNKMSIKSKSPVLMINRNDNALWFSAYSPDTTVEYALRTPLGAPLLLANETYFDGDKTNYRFPRALHKECKIFIESADAGIISCREMPPVSAKAIRRIRVTGLKNASIIILPRKGYENKTKTELDFHFPYIDTRSLNQELFESPLGPAIRVTFDSGELMVSDLK